jgi:hypothetical protein
MPPKRKSPPIEGQLEPNKAFKRTYLLKELVADFGDLKLIQFKLFWPEQERLAKALLLLNFLIQPV